MKIETIQSPNATIEIYDSFVKKILKNRATVEKLKRFNKECVILKELKDTDLNIVQVLEINTSDSPPWYTMKRYLGDSNLLLEHTKGNVNLVVKYILPIVKTLKSLSELEPPIFHRDIKPENILFYNDGLNNQLVLSDFGCAYFHDSDEDRITLDYRAVGARAFLAPEYHHGKVDNVTQKGDIFSIGKLLWYFVNGIACDVYPYTLWFPEEYNLLNRFPNVPGIAKLVSIIASCSHHEASKRIDYETLISSLNSMIDNSNISEDADRKLKALMYEQRIALELEQANVMASSILDVFLSDTRFAINSLQTQFGSLQIINQIVSGYRLVSNVQETLKGVVSREINYPLWNFTINNISINSRFYPAKESNNLLKKPIAFPYISFAITTTSTSNIKFSKSITWFFDTDNSLKHHINDVDIVHTQNLFRDLFFQALDNCFS